MLLGLGLVLLLRLVEDVEQVLKARLVLGLHVNLAGDLVLQVLEAGLIWVDALVLVVEQILLGLADVSSVEAHLLHQVGVIVTGIDRVVATHVLVTGRVASLDIVVRNDLLDLEAGVLEVRLRAQPLGDDGDVVVVFGRVVLVLDGADVDLLLVDHDHHLPLVLILGHSPEAGASEVVAADVVVDSLRLGVDNNLVEILFVLEGLQQFDLHLAVLTEALRLLDLVAQSDLHRGVSVIIFVIHRL